MSLAEHDCIAGAPALDGAALAALLPQLPAWHVVDHALQRRYRLADWQAGLAFVNAISAMVEQQNHHPILTMRYTSCDLSFTTDSAGQRLTLNDFICAARADALYASLAGARP